MESTEKKPRKANKSLTLAEKVAVIQKYTVIKNTRDLAKMFGCGRTQIQNILHRAEEYMAAWNSDKPERILSVQPARMLTLGAMVWEWFHRCKNHNLIVNNEQIFRVASKVAKILRIKNFRPTKTWFNRLKLKYKYLRDIESKCLEKKSLNIEDIVEDFKDSKPTVTRLPALLEVDPFSDVPFQSVADGDCKDNANLNKNKLYELELIKNTTDGPVLYNISFDVNDEEPKQENEEQQQEEDEEQKQEYQDYKQEEDNEKSTTICSSDGSEILRKDKNQYYKLPTVVDTYKQALNHLGPLEQFALAHEDIRAVGLINQLENLFRNRMSLN